MDRSALYDAVTARLVEDIETGAATWRMPWAAIAETGSPVNALTNVAYRGGNHLYFALIAASRGWSGRWATYRQWQQLGAQVRRGERATHGIKWSLIENDDKQTRMVPFCFSVFEAAQVDGWTAPASPKPSPVEREHVAEALFAAAAANVSHGGNVAAYSPSRDQIHLPRFEQFNSPLDYYATSAHEHAHWTGHASRLDRNLSGRFGSDSYAAEELVAEISAAFTCAHLGIALIPRPDHAAYLKSWLRILRADSSAIFHAASKAQAATDYLVQLASTKEMAA